MSHKFILHFPPQVREGVKTHEWLVDHLLTSLIDHSDPLLYYITTQLHMIYLLCSNLSGQITLQEVFIIVFILFFSFCTMAIIHPNSLLFRLCGSYPYKCLNTYICIYV